VRAKKTGAAADKEASKAVADMFVSLRGALAYTTLTQAWMQVYIAALQRVQTPTNLDVRRLNAVTRKLQQKPRKLIFKAMTCSKACDIHTDSGYRKVTTDDDTKGYGIRGLCLLRKGIGRTKTPVVHLLESLCKSHRLTIKTRFGSELIAAAHGLDDIYSTLVTIAELPHGRITAQQLKSIREHGGLPLEITLTTDSEDVYKSIMLRDLKNTGEKTLLGHVEWLRELVNNGIIQMIQCCDTRDMTAEGHTKGRVERTGLLEVMVGRQTYKHPVKRHSPPHAKVAVRSDATATGSRN